ncbi:MAG TPA: PH domain-containing protein [Pseudolysinimonas sp.]
MSGSGGTGEVVPEAVVARLRPHARALFWPSAALVAIAGATAFFTGSFRQEWLNWLVLAVAGLLTLVLFVAPLLAWLGRSYTITTRRIVLRSGLLVRTRQELLHSRGYDVTVRQAGLQLLFRSGDVLVNTGQEHPVVLKDVPNAELVQSALHDLMEASLNPIGARRRPGSWEHPGETDEQDFA